MDFEQREREMDREANLSDADRAVIWISLIVVVIAPISVLIIWWFTLRT